ncbi:MAG: TolC family protein [Bacteroidaceae bacterium]|nr:TolC family protein [Bacteroidaceae bacterium]
MTRSIFVFFILLLAAPTTKGQDGEKFLTYSLPDSWNDNSYAEQTMPDNDLWWRNFEDAQLDSLITVATRQNFSALAAIENIKRAKAVWRQAQSAMLPQVALSAGWQRARSSGNTALSEYRESVGGYYSAAVNVNWQIDVFGGIYMRSKTQKRLFQATEEEYRAVMVALCANVASTYFSIKQGMAQLEVLRNNVASQEEIIKIVTSRYNSGLASKLDVAQSKSVYYNTLAQIPAMEASISGYRNSLAVLLGCSPGDLDEWPSQVTALPSYVEPVEMGVPATLLLRRPDIRKAEKEIEAYAAALGAAKRDWLPEFYLTGSVGYEADKLKELPNARSLTWQIAPAMQWKLFTGGDRINATREARATLEQSILSFNNSVLTAMQEVESAMSLYSSSIAQTVATKEAVNQCRETLELSLELYKQGLTQFQNVLDAQRTLLSYQDYLVQAQGASLKSLVQLYEALGGGW